MSELVNTIVLNCTQFCKSEKRKWNGNEKSPIGCDVIMTTERRNCDDGMMLLWLYYNVTMTTLLFNCNDTLM